MKKILTCGTFDLFHIGHLNFLKKAKKEGNYLIVAVSSKKCNYEKNKNSFIKQTERMEIVKSCKYVDEVISEESLLKKQYYIDKYDIDLFVIGDNWKNKFDNLSCEVKYLKRTNNISTSLIKKNLSYNFIFFDFYKIQYNFINKLLKNIFYSYNLLINPNLISIASLLMFIPIYFFNNVYLKSLFCVIHNLLDNADGVMARIYEYKDIKRNKKFGAFLDAILDKIFVFLMILIIPNNILKFKIIIHIISVLKRTSIYLKKTEVNKNYSTYSGKLSTFLENVSFFFYFCYPEFFNIIHFLSIIFQIQSLYEKFL